MTMIEFRSYIRSRMHTCVGNFMRRTQHANIRRESFRLVTSSQTPVVGVGGPFAAICIIFHGKHMVTKHIFALCWISHVNMSVQFSISCSMYSNSYTCENKLFSDADVCVCINMFTHSVHCARYTLHLYELNDFQICELICGFRGISEDNPKSTNVGPRITPLHSSEQYNDSIVAHCLNSSILDAIEQFNKSHQDNI